jgi:hypothetical protein
MKNDEDKGTVAWREREKEKQDKEAATFFLCQRYMYIFD